MYQGALRGDIGHGLNGYYFGENGEHSMLDVADSIGKALKKRGLGEAEPKTLSKQELDKYTGGVSVPLQRNPDRELTELVHVSRYKLARPGAALA